MKYKQDFERAASQPIQYVKPCYKNYNPYDEMFEQPDGTEEAHT